MLKKFVLDILMLQLDRQNIVDILFLFLSSETLNVNDTNLVIIFSKLIPTRVIFPQVYT